MSMVLAFVALFGAVTLNTEWQDVPDTEKIGSVLNLGNGPVAVTNAAEAVVRAYDATNLTGRLDAKYVKPSGGIPMEDLAPGVYNTIFAKQDALVSGTNIKTINNQSILGAGNLVIQGGGGTSDYTTTNAVKSIINSEVGGTNTLVHSSQIADFVTKSVTNGLASTAWVEGKGYLTTETDPTATAKAQAAIAAAGCVTTNANGVINYEVVINEIGGYYDSEVRSGKFEALYDGSWSAYGRGLPYYVYNGASFTKRTNYRSGGEIWDEEVFYLPFSESWATANASNRIARIADIPTDYIPAAGDTNSVDAILNAARTDSASIAEAKAADTRAIVATWENFLDGSNVVFSITNYISGTYNLDNAKFRILEMTNGFYREVYNSREEITMHINNFKNNDFRVATNQVITSVNEKIAGKADKAWGRYTSAGGVAPSNTVYMTEPQTVFAGGLEYERVAVGEGSVCVLTTAGAPVYTAGDEGTFKFQDDGGTNYFGFAKTDSYTIGCNTDGITVQNSIVTLTYNVTMSGVPCIWYKQDVGTAGPWEQLNLSDGTAVPGASHLVTWDMSPAAGTEVCYINCANQAKGFFKATVEVPGSAKFMTNMPADLGGGIICTNTATGVNGVIRPSFNGSTVIWSWSAQ